MWSLDSFHTPDRCIDPVRQQARFEAHAEGQVV
jgi:hypothetical protein